MRSIQRLYLPRKEWRFKGDFELRDAGPLCRGMAVLTDRFFGWRGCIFPPLYGLSLVRWFDAIDLSEIEAVAVKTGWLGAEFFVQYRVDEGVRNSLSYWTLGPDRWVSAWRSVGIEVEGANQVEARSLAGKCRVYWWICFFMAGMLGWIALVVAFSLMGKAMPPQSMLAYAGFCQIVVLSYYVYWQLRPRHRR